MILSVCLIEENLRSANLVGWEDDRNLQLMSVELGCDIVTYSIDLPVQAF